METEKRKLTEDLRVKTDLVEKLQRDIVLANKEIDSLKSKEEEMRERIEKAFGINVKK